MLISPRSSLSPVLALLGLFTAVTRAEPKLNSLFSDHTVIQRGKPVPVWGTAAPGEKVTVSFHGQTATATADARGGWEATLPALEADPVPQNLTVTGNSTVTIKDVLIGDVWLCSGQSNMAFGLGGTGRTEDIASADFPGIRQFSVPLVPSDKPLGTVDAGWTVCSPATANGFSAVSFYFARKVYRDNGAKIPIGLVVSSVGGTRIDPWLAPEGVAGEPVLAPLFSQAILPFGPFALFNGMIHPLAPYALKGILWYQGENNEASVQSPDSYYLKLKALAHGWSQLFRSPDLPFYLVQIANWGRQPTSSAPDFSLDGWSADTRLQEARGMSLPRAGMASAIDIGESDDMHPKDKLDLGERLALWALKNEYGQSALVTSGPILRNATVAGATVVCEFDYAGGGLMAGSKLPYQPTVEEPGTALRLFSIAGADGKWFPATAVIQGNTVVLSSPSVAAPRKVSYANWQNPLGCNLYNREGLPASPFYVDDVTVKYTLTATAGPGGSISPAGAKMVLPRSTNRYVITPDAGNYIQDVKVDGKSVGSPEIFTFDPAYADHSISATFGPAAPSYTVKVIATGGGTVIPSGNVSVTQGEGRTFRIAADPGCQVSLKADGAPVGERPSYTFSDVRADHVLSAEFTCPIIASAGYGGLISPGGTVAATYGSQPAFTITALPGFVVADVKVDGKSIGARAQYAFPAVTQGHTIMASFAGGTKGGSVPRPGDILFSSLASALPDSGSAGAWPTAVPAGKTLSPLGDPHVVKVDGRKYVSNLYTRKDGFRQGTYSAPIAVAGASVIVVARPLRGASGGWTSIVDVFYDRLVLGVRNETGKICVRSNGSLDESAAAIPDGQLTLFILVVQPDGAYKVYANGVEALSKPASAAFTALAPNGNFNAISVGRGPDDWTVFNGEIGDVYLYKSALSDAERQGLEAYLTDKLVGGNVVPVSPGPASRKGLDAGPRISLTSGSLALDFAQAAPRTLVLLGRDGRRLAFARAQGLHAELPRAGLAHGVYFLRVETSLSGRVETRTQRIALGP